MRELKDYFCTYEQMESIVDLGYQPNFVVLRESLDEAAPTHSGIMNCQALDFFRDLGYEIIQETTKSYICWHVIIKGEVKTYVDGDLLFHVSESFLISKLIELEKEARNGN